ncbi:MAG: ATP-binding protein, partial [Pseudomonadota bacterium]
MSEQASSAGTGPGPADLTLLSDQAPIALVQIGPDQRTWALNPAAEALFGTSSRALVGLRLDDAFVDGTALTTLLSFALQSEGDVSAPDIEVRTSLYQPALRLTVRIRYVGRDGLVVALSQPMGHEREDGVPGVAGMGRILGHEVKNPLAGISGAAQLMLRRGREEDAELLELIRDETRRIERLINRFSAFELYSRPSLRPLNVHELLDRVVNAERAAFDGQITYHREYDPSLPDIPGDSDHLHEALLNVLRNGAEAAAQKNGSDGGAEISVRTAFEMNVPQGPRAKGVSRRAIRIDVEDNGPGIDPAKADLLFEAFESSKSSARGLGLTVVRDVVAAHGGHVSISDVPSGSAGLGGLQLSTGTGTRVSLFGYMHPYF